MKNVTGLEIQVAKHAVILLAFSKVAKRIAKNICPKGGINKPTKIPTATPIAICSGVPL